MSCVSNTELVEGPGHTPISRINQQNRFRKDNADGAGNTKKTLGRVANNHRRSQQSVIGYQATSNNTQMCF